MRLEAPYIEIARLPEADHASLETFVAQKLAPLFEPKDAELWRAVEERSRFIGETDRPADVGFRRMRPTGYAQLCVKNDESPPSPWARPIPHDVVSAPEQQALERRYSELCAAAYGDGVLYYLAFAILAPGGQIPRHRDMPHDVNKKAYSHHLHVPITAAASAEFILHDQKVFFQAGRVYEIDNMDWHSVENHGTAFRVNLMLDYCPRANLEARNAPSEPEGLNQKATSPATPWGIPT